MKLATLTIGAAYYILGAVFILLSLLPMGATILFVVSIVRLTMNQAINADLITTIAIACSEIGIMTIATIILVKWAIGVFKCTKTHTAWMRHRLQAL